MTKFLSLLVVISGVGLFTAGCADDKSSNSSAAVTPEVSNYVDISALPIEVGEYSTEAYTFRIANPFDNASGEPEASAAADVVLTYNGKPVTDIMTLDYNNTTASLNTDLIILSSTCGTNTSYGAVPAVLEKGQSCEFTYKIAPQAAFMYVNKLAVEYKKQGFFGTGTAGTGDADSSILTEEAFLEKAKAYGAYQLNETVLKYAGKRSEYAVNGTVYRDASQGTEIDHIFSKATGSLVNGAAGESIITETFEGGTYGATHTVTFLDIDNNAGTVTPFKSDVNAKMDMNTALLTFYQFNFTSHNPSSPDACRVSARTGNTMTITCDPNEAADLTIGLHAGDDTYYKEKYLKYDKAYYITSAYNKAPNAPQDPALNVYLLLARDNRTSHTFDQTNLELSVKCWESANADGTLIGSPQDLTNLNLQIFKKYENIYNSDGSLTTAPVDYVLVQGMCGNVEIDTEYLLTDFNDQQTGNNTIPTLVSQVVTYSPVSKSALDGIVRHNLRAR